DRLGHHDPARREVHGDVRAELGAGDAPVYDPVAPGEHLPPELRLAEAPERLVERGLVDGLRRQPEIRGTALGVAAATDPLEERPFHLAREARLPRREVRQLDAERRGDRALVRTALAAERHAGGRAGEDHPRADVERVDEGVEPAADERVVHRADRDELLPEEL